MLKLLDPRFRGDDKKRREDTELKNQADTLVYSVEKSLNENKDKLDPAEVKKVEEGLATAKKALEDKEIGKIKSTSEELTKASHKLAEILYKQAQEKEAAEKKGDNAGNGEETPKKKNDENVVDAEFEEGPKS